MKSLIKNFLNQIKTFNKYRLIKKYYSNIMNNPVELENLPGNNILVIAPHPDDEIIGCAGTLLKNSDKQITVFYNFNSDKQRIIEAEQINQKLNFKPVFLNKNFNTDIKNLLNNNKFDTVLIPNFIDNHQHHFNTVQSFYILLKQYSDYKFKIIMYEIWTPHQPNIIVDITDKINYKLDLLKFYKSQLINKDYINSVKGLNKYRSIFLKNQNNTYAESFVLINSINEFIKLYEYSNEI